MGGEFGDGLMASGGNLVMRALALLRARYGADRVRPLAVNLTKTLPVAAGVGGGSADAAAMARLVRRHFLPELGDPTLARLMGSLGADIAACVASATSLGTGTGAELSPVPERSEEHTSELQSLMRISYAVFCLKKQKKDESQHQD